MVGRAAELDRLVALIGARPVPAVALVAGEAGIGKTRLVQELLAAVPPGTFVLAGQADPGSVGRPMELFLDALRGTGAAAPSSSASSSSSSDHDELLAEVRDGERSAEERVRAAVELVRRLTGDRPGVVVFEDLHWADAESLTLLERLAEPDRGSLLVVGTYRPDGLSRRHPAADLLPRLDRRHTVTHIHLDRLGPGEVSSFLAAVYGGDPSFRVVDALHTRTGGHPFFLEELVASSRDAPEGLDEMPLPWTVAELVRSQLDDLDPDVREMVTTAAVLGRRVPFDVLAAVTGASEDDLIRRLRAAVDAGLLVEGEPDVFGFHHEIAREAIEAGLLGREQRRLHEKALAVAAGVGQPRPRGARPSRARRRALRGDGGGGPAGRAGVAGPGLDVPGAAAGRGGPHRGARRRRPAGRGLQGRLAHRRARRRRHPRRPVAAARPGGGRRRRGGRGPRRADPHRVRRRRRRGHDGLHRRADRRRRPGPRRRRPGPGHGRHRPVVHAARAGRAPRSSGPTGRRRWPRSTG